MAKKGLSHKAITNLALKLISYQVKKKIGEDVIGDIKEILDEEFQEKFIDPLGWNQEKVIEAFEEADKQFIKLCRSDVLKQAVISKPLARIPSLEKFATDLPQTLDDDGLLKILEQRFQNDWKNLSKTQIENAARLYRKCLDKSLASKAKQLPETSIRILTRLDTNFEELKEITNKLVAFQNKSDKPKKANYKKYLNDIIKKQNLWQKKYTQMFANFEELTLYAQVNESKETNTPLTTLINKTKKLIILGVAGSGKTTTLSKVALDNAKKAQQKKRGAFIPILLHLRNYRGSLKVLFEGQLRPWGIDIESFEDDLARGKFLLIFDGINEIPPDHKDNGLAELRELLSNYENNRFLFTSRNVGFQISQLSSDDQVTVPVCEIQSLEKDQIIDYIKRYLGAKVASLLITQLGINNPDIWKSERSLAQLVRIPIWLKMLITLFKKTKRVPRNEGELMLQFVDEVLLHEPIKAAGVFRPKTKKDILSTIAFAMHEEGLTGDAPKRYVDQVFMKRVPELIQPFETKIAEDLWQELQKNHLLVEEDELVSWPHPLFQELFVGLNLRDLCFDDLWRPRYVEIETRFDEIRVKLKWSRDFEAGTTMLGIVPEKYRPEALLAIGFYNPSLAYEAYRKMEPEFYTDLPRELLERGLTQLKSPRRGKEHRNLVRTISKIGFDELCTILINIANDCFSWEGREQALYEMWSHCKVGQINLLQFLQTRAEQDSATQVRIKALSFLMRIKQSWDIVIPFTIARLLLEPTDFEQNVRKLVTSEATQYNLFSKTLIEMSISKSIDTQRRSRGVWMLGEFLPANPSVKSTLISIVKDATNELEIRRKAIQALKGFKSTQTINYLGDLSHNEKEAQLRKEAIFTLATYSDKKTLTYVLSALKDTDQLVVEASIESLAQLAERLPVIEKLKDYCGKNDFALRQRSIKALSKICLYGSSEAGNASAKILRDFRTISDKAALRDIAIALKGYYPSDGAEVARRLYSISTIEEQQELLELFDEIND